MVVKLDQRREGRENMNDRYHPDFRDKDIER